MSGSAGVVGEAGSDYVVYYVARRIAGDIVLSSDPGAALRKWREYFGVQQSRLARAMGVSTSVISDYEKGRRVPGARFIQRFVRALLELDLRAGGGRLERLARGLGVPPGVVVDMREFERPLTLGELAEAVRGTVLAPEFPVDRMVYGYTVVDSIRAIVALSGVQFYSLLGGTVDRAVVFTGVQLGRSPMVAVRVSPVKPSVVVIHGPRGRVDPLAIELAKLEGVPLILSLAKSVGELVASLRAAAGGAAAPGGR
ncbi:MAG: helix-turn-helix domain-containing protein [Desulfurococcales archaeon]|nr:helix-turn-helix domain-containing protein [Desulfurococcales archaeon]